jgi:hypothetical protein
MLEPFLVNGSVNTLPQHRIEAYAELLLKKMFLLSVQMGYRLRRRAEARLKFTTEAEK